MMFSKTKLDESLTYMRLTKNDLAYLTELQQSDSSLSSFMEQLLLDTQRIQTSLEWALALNSGNQSLTSSILTIME